MPSASHGTDSTAPSRKKTRNVPLSQPVETPVARAAEARANIASAIVQARSCGRWSRVKRTSVAWANSVATAVARKASPTTMGGGAYVARFSRLRCGGRPDACGGPVRGGAGGSARL